MSTSRIPPDLIEAYRAAAYRVETDTATFILHVGQACTPLAELLAATGQSSATFITAYNPFSQARDAATNRQANDRLRAQLMRHCKYIFPAAGVDATGTWPDEPGYLALGLTPVQAKALGVEFGQNALVRAEADGVPQLALLR